MITAGVSNNWESRKLNYAWVTNCKIWKSFSNQFARVSRRKYHRDSFFVNYIHVLSYDHQKCWQQRVNITGARRNSSNYLKTAHSLDAAVKSIRSQHCSRSKTKFIIITAFVITLRAKLSSAVYCNRSCLFVCLFVCLWVCYHDNWKLRASIFTKLGL